jgi:hypothetical protein
MFGTILSALEGAPVAERRINRVGFHTFPACVRSLPPIDRIIWSRWSCGNNL